MLSKLGNWKTAEGAGLAGTCCLCQYVVSSWSCSAVLGTAGNFTCTRTRCADDLDEENNLKLRFQVGIDHFRSATGKEGMLERVINKPAVSLYLWSTNIFDTIF